MRHSRGAARPGRTKAANLLEITKSHREIWRRLAENPELGRVLDPDADPASATDEERRFMREVILHLAASFEADRLGALATLEKMGEDTGQLLAKPIPAAVWQDLRPYQNARFVQYVEQHIGAGARGIGAPS